MIKLKNRPPDDLKTSSPESTHCSVERHSPKSDELATRAHGDKPIPDPVNWGRSIFVRRRIENRPVQEKRFLIERDSLIDGGVYYGGSGGREGIVVDFKKDKSLQELYQIAFDKSIENGVLIKSKFMKNVFELVKKTFSNASEFQIAQIVAKGQVRPDQKVAIGVFIRSKTGVCRHMALTCAVLMEKAVKDGYLDGKVSVDRNSIRGVGAHAWCRYTNSAGTAIIMDAMHDVLKTLADTKGTAAWSYSRPEDLRSRPKKLWRSLMKLLHLDS